MTNHRNSCQVCYFHLSVQVLIKSHLLNDRAVLAACKNGGFGSVTLIHKTRIWKWLLACWVSNSSVRLRSHRLPLHDCCCSQIHTLQHVNNYFLHLGGVVGITGASEQEGSMFHTCVNQGHISVQFPCVGFVLILWFPRTVQRYVDQAKWLILIAHRCKCEWEWLLVSVLVWIVVGLCAGVNGCLTCP